MRTKNEEAAELPNRHYQVEAGLERIFRLTGSEAEETSPREPIKLLEVNAYTVPTGIMPIRFGPAPESGFHYPSVILEITQTTTDEYRRVQSRELELPHGWRVGEEIPKPSNGVF